MLKNHKSQLKFFYFILISVFSIITIAFIETYPKITGDLETNYKVAKNILSGCGVSISALGSGECVAHFGGNQGPAYPFLIASFFYFFGENFDYVRYFQSLTLLLSLIFFFITLEKFNFVNNKFKLFSILFLFSPLAFPWSRFISSDTIAISILILYFSFFVISIKNNKIEVFPLAVLLGIGTQFRFDFILLTFTLLIFFNLYHSKKFFFIDMIKISIIGMIIWTPWTLRNLDKGVSILPTHQQQQATFNSSEYYPKGINKWLSTWMTHEYERVGTVYNLNNKNYSKIKFNYKNSFADEKEKQDIINLLNELSAYNGQNFPPQIDKQFELIAKKKINSNPIKHYIKVPLTRIFYMWFNYKNSYGWPFEISNKINNEMVKKNYNLSIKNIIEVAYQNSNSIIGKLTISIYRFVIFITFFLLFFYKKNNSLIGKIAQAVLIFFIVKSCFHGYLNIAETRYTLPVYVLMQFVVFSRLLKLNFDKH